MITNLFINQHSLPTSGWRYNTFSYGFNYTFWSRFEIGYVLVIFNGAWNPYATTRREKIMRNQDRHFTGRFQLLKNGDFGIDWLPNIVVGMSDIATGDRENGYKPSLRNSSANGYFNRLFITASKAFPTAWGEVNGHLGYQLNNRADYVIDAPCAAVSWKPIWAKDFGPVNDVDVILEFDSRTINFGFIASLWDKHFEAMFETQAFRWINFGLRYKFVVN